MIKNQKGFAVLETLLILVIIGIIGGTGYYVWHSKNQTDKVLSQADKISQSMSTKSPTPKTPSDLIPPTYLTIKEWGVKIPLSSDTRGLNYKTSGIVASFRTTALNDVSGNCESNSIYVARGKANEVVPNELGSDGGTTFITAYNNTTVDKTNLTARSIKAKIGDYYFVVPGFASASCASSGNTDKETTSVLNIVKAINQMAAE